MSDVVCIWYLNNNLYKYGLPTSPLYSWCPAVPACPRPLQTSLTTCSSSPPARPAAEGDGRVPPGDGAAPGYASPPQAGRRKYC